MNSSSSLGHSSNVYLTAVVGMVTQTGSAYKLPPVALLYKSAVDVLYCCKDPDSYLPRFDWALVAKRLQTRGRLKSMLCSGECYYATCYSLIYPPVAGHYASRAIATLLSATNQLLSLIAIRLLGKQRSRST